jgi:hypothetical protein
MLRAFGGTDDVVKRWAAVLGIFGVVGIPIIIVSVRLLPGIHPAVLMTREGTSGLVDPRMRLALYVTALAFVLGLARAPAGRGSSGCTGTAGIHGRGGAATRCRRNGGRTPCGFSIICLRRMPWSGSASFSICCG